MPVFVHTAKPWAHGILEVSSSEGNKLDETFTDFRMSAIISCEGQLFALLSLV